MNQHLDGITEWLLEGDPSIRWQVMRDLQALPETTWLGERALVGSTGWGAELLSHQDTAGRWTPRLYGHKWISTTYSMVLLRRLGLSPLDSRAQPSCLLFLDEGLWPDGGINISVSVKRSETCVTGMVLGLLGWFQVDDPRREALVGFLLEHQMSDGGWNCEWDRGATHGSFHTTINVLEGLREYDDAGGEGSRATRAAEASGREFLLDHRLFRSHRTGEVVDPRMLRLSFPPRWHYDVLRCLDYFRSAGDNRDDRLADAIDALEARRRADGRWPLQQRYAGATWFEMEQVGQPSRWNTLRAMRVLDWWDGRFSSAQR